MNKKKNKFNIVDVLLILAIVAVVAVLYYYMSARTTVTLSNDVEIEYVVELKTIPREFLQKIKIGDTVVETIREQQVGEIVDINISPAYMTASNLMTGEIYIQYYPPINGQESTDENMTAEAVIPEASTEKQLSESDSEEATEETDASNPDELIEDAVDNAVEEMSISEELIYDYYNVKVTVRDTFKKTDTGYKINAFTLLVGEVMYFRVPEFIGEGFCISIKELSKEAK